MEIEIDSNGYPAYRRSLVEDAKFESTIKKQHKQSILFDETAKISLESGLSEEEVVQFSSWGDEEQNVILILTLQGSVSALPRIIKTIENFTGTIHHVETRALHEASKGYEVLLRVILKKEPLINILKSLRQGTSSLYVRVLPDNRTACKDLQWFPTHISDLDLCNHLMTKFEPDLDMNHPGFADKSYRARRKQIADIAFSYKYGESIPRVNYRPEEISTWGAVYSEVDELIPTLACKEFVYVWKLLKDENIYRADCIPQLQDVSDFMQKRTGFTLRPAAGLLTARDFLASLAFRVFQCTQYVRHHTSPHHSPEPDVIHELLGHAPLLADSKFAQFSQELGLASLGATDEEIEKFATMYWFTVEFGLCREGNQIKAWGAGLLSSFGELKHALSDRPQIKSFDPAVTSIQPYQDQDYQDLYFLAESVDDAQAKFRQWADTTLRRPFEILYNPYSQSVMVLRSRKELQEFAMKISSDVEKLKSALTKLYF